MCSGRWKFPCDNFGARGFIISVIPQRERIPSLPGNPRRLQGTPGNPREPQGTQGNPREPHGTLEDFGRSQTTPGNFRGNLGNPRETLVSLQNPREPQGPLEGTLGNPQGTPVNSRRLQGTRLQSKSIGHASVSRELQPCCVCYAIFKLLHWQITCT